MSFLQSLLAFIFVIGILVTVHEFGHYWVAKRLGVKILRFSIGFGKPLWMRRFGRDETEFVIAAIPLGGYVKMLDENEFDEENENTLSNSELKRAFNRQPLKVRIPIVLAGPFANFIFAIFAYMLMFILGISGLKSIVGGVEIDSLAEQAGFQSGYEITAVDGHTANRWESVIQTTLRQMLDNKEIKYTVRTESDSERSVFLDLHNLSVDDIAQGNFFDEVGITPFRPPFPAIVGGVADNSAAERAGLLKNDKILSLDDQKISAWTEWANYVAERPDQEIQAIVERNSEQITLVLVPENLEGKGRMGVYALKNYSIPDEFMTTERYGLINAFLKGIEKTWDTSVLTLRLLGKMLTLEVSAKNISGPITIAQFAGKTAQIGIVPFLYFLGLISVSLGVLNLLPIPMLDGGHLFFYTIEGLKGSPVSESVEEILQKVGIVLLAGLMSLAMFNDLERLFSG